MAVEKFLVDVKHYKNSKIVYSGFTDNLLKGFELNKDTKLEYTDALDDYIDKYLKQNTDGKSPIKKASKRRTVIADYMKNTNDYSLIPMVLKNAVVNLYYKKKKKSPRIISSSYIKSVSNPSGTVTLPLIANLSYGNFKHDPHPQVFVMSYDTVRALFEGINLNYLTISELKKLITFHIKYPNASMVFFYHQILKTYGVKKASHLYMKDVRKHFGLKLSETDITKIQRTSGMLYPKNEQGHSVLTAARARALMPSKKKSEPVGYERINNMLGAYRKYKQQYCLFSNIDIEFFNE